MANPNGNPLWRRGYCANPGGRPRAGTSLTKMIRERVPLDELVELSMAMARGEPVIRQAEYMRELYKARAEGRPEPPRPPAAEVVYPSIADQQRAIEFLAQWGYQRPAEKLEISTAPEVDLASLSDEELEQYERLLSKAQVRERVIDAVAVPVRAALPAGR